MLKSLKIVAVLGFATTLVACGTTDAERAATGAIIGGAIAAVTDENIVNGALIGGAAGAVSCSVAPGTPNCVN
jgi:osmotically inducible lipoprotein OsmB